MPVPASEAPFTCFTSQWHNTTYPSISPTKPELSAKGKSVFITGAGSGIGAAIAEAFAQAGAAHIAILGRREHKLNETRDALAHYGSKVHVYAGSVTDVDKVNDSVSQFANIVGKIDVLISNAGGAELGQTVADADVDAWMGAVDLNVKGPLVVTQAFLRHAAPHATIVNVSSGLSFMFLGNGTSSYSASKSAGVTLFSHLQRERPDLRVVSIQPGVVASDLNRKHGAPAMDDGFCVWLASPEADFTAGKYLFVNWDVDDLKAKASEISQSGVLEMWLDGAPHK